MQLHRTTGKPDWAAVLPGQRNYWQRLAAHSHGLVTPANAATAVGFALVCAGLVVFCQHHYWPGLVMVAAGRLCDLLDGWLAEATGTKSPLGELLDVTADKLGTLAAVIACFAAHVAPYSIIAALVLPHAVISVITVYAYCVHRPLHPTQLGKLGMAATWACLVGLLVITAADAGSPYTTVAYTASILTAVFGLYNAANYGRRRDG